MTEQLTDWHLNSDIPIIIITKPNKRVRDSFKSISTNVIHWPLSLPRLYRVLTDAIQYQNAATRPQPIQSNISILLVDDDAINLAAVQLLLERLGLHADTVSDGYGALEFLNNHKVDLIIMDMRMGTMDGYTTTRSIRENVPPETQPMIVILTAGVTPNQLNALQSSGIDAYIEKPISIDNLINLVESVRHKKQILEVSTSMIRSQSPDLASTNADLSPVDFNTLKNLLKLAQSRDNDDPDILGLFFENTPDLIENAYRAAQQGNLDRLKDLLHALRGTCEIFGAERLSHLCNQMEKNLNEGTSLDIQKKMDEIQNEFNSVKDIIGSFIDDPQTYINLTN